MLPGLNAPHVPAHHLAREAATLGDLFLRRVRRNPQRTALYYKEGGLWSALSWQGFYDRAAAVAGGLVALGLRPGERVAILGPTCPTWAATDLGAQLAGLCSVGLYPQQPADALRYLLSHSEARVLFIDGEDELTRALEAARELPLLQAIVPFGDALFERHQRSAAPDPRVQSPRRFLAAPIDPAEESRRQAALARDDAAILIYTSGTTGPPKGAMISHDNILSLLAASDSGMQTFEDDLALVYLPMAHSAERILSFYGRLSTGVAAAYASSVGAVLTELREVRPTLFGSVPRIFEKAYSKIHGDVERKPPLVRRLFAWASDVGRRRIRLVLAGQPVPLTLALQHRLADRLVFSKIRAAFGGRVRELIVGAAPTAREIMEFFWAAGLPIFEAYGMTEATVITHMNRPQAVRLGSVGRPLPGVTQRIAEDGEILIQAPWIFLGYLKNEAATAEIKEGGWLHTGDVGRIDEDGYLSITDRKKHLIITAGGKNLTPANIEAAIKGQDPLISQVHAHGDRRPYVVALVAPSPIETLEWGQDRGLVDAAEVAARTAELVQNPTARSAALHQAMAKVVSHPEFAARLTAAVRRGNERLAHVEQVRRFRVLPRDLCQEHGELTPTMKVKRKEVEARYAADLERIYDEPGFGIDVTGSA